MKLLLRRLMQNHSGWWEAWLIFTVVVIFNEALRRWLFGCLKRHSSDANERHYYHRFWQRRRKTVELHFLDANRTVGLFLGNELMRRDGTVHGATGKEVGDNSLTQTWPELRGSKAGRKIFDHKFYFQSYDSVKHVRLNRFCFTPEHFNIRKKKPDWSHKCPSTTSNSFTLLKGIINFSDLAF